MRYPGTVRSDVAVNCKIAKRETVKVSKSLSSEMKEVRDDVRLASNQPQVVEKKTGCV